MLRPFIFSLITTVAVLLAVIFSLGWAAALTTIILIAIEITFSFDNAIINAKILAHLTPAWQKLFLTLGIVIAIFGMRIVFPIIIVVITAHLGWQQAVELAVHHPHDYARHLQLAHTSIAAFGGAFLLTLALYFFLDDGREVLWLRRIERSLRRFANWYLPLVVAAVIVLLAGLMPFNHHPRQSVGAGFLGIVTYSLLKLLTDSISKVIRTTKHSAYLASLVSFIYLEILDASFSFDGVIGAFAITSMVVLIAAGLGVGAVWVRSLTVFMVKRGTLNTYVYLEHGAHYTVALLGVLLLASLWVTIPDAVSGGVGVVIIGLALRASIIEKRLTRR